MKYEDSQSHMKNTLQIFYTVWTTTDKNDVTYYLHDMAAVVHTWRVTTRHEQRQNNQVNQHNEICP